MTELIIALAMGAVVATGIYSVYVSEQKRSTSQRVYNDLQNDLRFAMDYMKNELYLGGFMTQHPEQPIRVATTATISFEYLDEQRTADATFNRVIETTYWVDGSNNLRRGIKKWNTSSGQFEPTAPGVYAESGILARDVTSLAFDYRMSNDNDFTPGTDDPADIRTIVINLTGQSRKADPYLKDTSGNPLKRTLTLQGEVQARNLAISHNPFDETPPNVPTGLNVWDSQQCGRLIMEWDANSDPDLGGYYIFYGLSSGSYTGRSRINRGPGSGKESFTLTGLTSYDAPYYVAISAFDRSANVSGLSGEAHGDPDPDITTSGGADDTTINPAVPEPPENFAANQTANNDEIQLSWTASPTGGVEGYRLFRSTQPDYSDETMVVNESILGPDSTGYLDVSAPGNVLLGCTDYYYRIVAMHCDPSVFPTDYTYPDDYAEAQQQPIDGSPPSVPVLEARPGYRRIVLNVDNPVRGDEPDFSHSMIYFSTSGFPSIDTAGVVSGGATIPDFPPYGHITDDGTVPPILFDSEWQVAPPEPELQPDTTYYFLAVAYDTCGNHTEATSESLAEGQQCGDCDPGEDCFEAPPEPSGFATGGCGTRIDLDWADIDQLQYRDLSGYFLFRREGETWLGADPATEVDLTGGAFRWISDWTDTTSGTNPVQMGKVYSYLVCSIDCYYFQHSGKPAAEWPDPANDPNDNLACREINGLYVGDFEKSPTRNFTVTGGLDATPPTFRHNTVTYWIDNLAGGTLTQDSVSAEWTNPDAFLRRIVIGDGSTTNRDVIDFLPPIPFSSTANFSPPKIIDGVDNEVPVTFMFTAADGVTVDRSIDMRQEFVDPTYSFTNDSTGDSTCSYSHYQAIFASRGPVVLGTVQDQPAAPTVSWPVPGDEGVNVLDKVLVKGNREVIVRTNVIPDGLTGASIVSVSLRYFVDVGALGIVPAAGDYTNVISMSNVAGNEWVTSTPIPVSNDSSVWYYILAVDSSGNFDREPEISPISGNPGGFQYYQQPPDVCDDIPGPVELFAGTAAGTTVTLTWDIPSYSTDPTLPGVLLPFTDEGGYNVFRNDGTGWQKVAGPSGDLADPTVAAGDYTFTESLADIDTVTYQYAVTAIDTCPNPGPNEGPASTVFTECLGAAECIFTAIPSGAVPMFPTDSLDLSLAICSKQGGGTTPGEVVYVQTCSGAGDADSIEMIEIGDSGIFEVNAGLYAGRQNVRLYPQSDPPAVLDATLDLFVFDSGTDVVHVGGAQDGPYTNDVCEVDGAVTQQYACGPASVFPVTPDPCAAPVVPEPPTNFQVTDPNTNCNSSREVYLTWNSSVTAEVTGYEVYRCEDINCDTQSLVGTTADTFFGPYAIGAKLNTTSVYFRVRAVNRVCPINIQYSVFTATTEDPCP